MCVTIKPKNGEEIETVEEFEKYFNIDATAYADKHYGNKIKYKACLCQLDLDSFFKNKNFTFEGMYWEEK
jgi:hypothetical protein